jgi:hypothetical protein
MIREELQRYHRNKGRKERMFFCSKAFKNLFAHRAPEWSVSIAVQVLFFASDLFLLLSGLSGSSLFSGRESFSCITDCIQRKQDYHKTIKLYRGL